MAEFSHFARDVLGSDISWGKHLQLNAYVRDVTGEIRRQGQANAAEQAQTNANLSHLIRQGADQHGERMESLGALEQGLGDLRADIAELGARFEWGMGRLLTAVGGVNARLDRLLEAVMTPEFRKEELEYMRRGIEAYGNGWLPEALGDFQRVLERNPRNHVAWSALGATLLYGVDLTVPEDERLEQAQEAFAKAMRYARPYDPGEAASAALLGAFTCYLLRRFDDATARTQQALELAPELVEARWLQARTAALQGQVERAIPLLEQVLVSSPFYAERLHTDLDFRPIEPDVAALLTRLTDALAGQARASLAALHTTLAGLTWRGDDARSAVNTPLVRAQELISGGFLDQVRALELLRDAGSALARARLPVHELGTLALPNELYRMATSCPGTGLVAIPGDHEVWLLRLPSATPVARVKADDLRVAVFSPGGAWFAFAGPTTGALVRTSDGQVVATDLADGLAAFSHDGSWLATGGARRLRRTDGTAVMSWPAGWTVREIHFHRSRPRAIAALERGHPYQTQTLVLDLETSRELARFEGDPQGQFGRSAGTVADHIVISTAGRYVLVDVVKGVVVRDLGVQAGGMRVSPGGQWLLINPPVQDEAVEGSRLVVQELSTGREVWTMQDPAHRISEPALFDDERRMLVDSYTSRKKFSPQGTYSLVPDAHITRLVDLESGRVVNDRMHWTDTFGYRFVWEVVELEGGVLWAPRYQAPQNAWDLATGEQFPLPWNSETAAVLHDGSWCLDGMEYVNEESPRLRVLIGDAVRTSDLEAWHAARAEQLASEEQRKRQQAADRRQAEQAEFKVAGRCIDCGSPLGFWLKLRSAERCKACGAAAG